MLNSYTNTHNSISVGIGKNRLASSGPPAFSPSSLFAGSESGDWYIVSDLTKLFQNSDGTGAVSTDGDRVGYIGGQSKSRNLIQATAGNRPTYRTSGGLSWLEFASGQSLVEDVETLIIPATTYVGVSSTPTDTGVGVMLGAVRAGTGANIRTIDRNTNIVYGRYVKAGDIYQKTKPLVNYISYSDSQGISGATVSVDLIINNVAATITGTDDGPIGNQTVTTRLGINTLIGSASIAASSTLNFYGGILITRTLTTPERISCTTYFGSKAGLVL